MTTQPMLLDSVGHGETKLGRWGMNEQLDALPYADELPAGWRTKVDVLVQEEMRRMPKSKADYLKELPPVPASRFEEGSVIANELARVAAGQPAEPLDTSRYSLQAPAANRRNDHNAWKAALSNAQAQLEHQALRLTNLELAAKYGANAWKANLQHLDASCAATKRVVAETKGEIEAVNRSRKLHQTAVGEELKKLEGQWMGLIGKNMEIDAACRLLEQQVSELQAAKDAKTGGSEEATEPMVE